MTKIFTLARIVLILDQHLSSVQKLRGVGLEKLDSGASFGTKFSGF